MSKNVYDYIIIGAGSAGCVLASRLTEDHDVRVLLLEAGGPDRRWDWRLHMPAALAYPLMNDTYNWAYYTEPEPGLGGRRMYCPRGRVLGGSSSINGMVYIRGNALDYDHWARAKGLEHWSYRHCLPYFKKAETRDIGPSDYHGGDGPLYVSTPKAGNNPLYNTFIEAGVQAGYPRTDDLNGYQQEGFGPMDRTTTRDGRRASTARVYLDAARKRPNLTVLTRVTTDRVLFDGSRATGVAYLQDGELHQAYAEREVIISSGAINSPQVLLRSGIGNADELRQLDIPVVQHLPGVGQNLQDHLEMYVQYECLKPITLYPALKWWNQPKIGAEWLFLGSGIGASNQFEAGGFIRTGDEVEFPNLQYHFVPVAMNYDGRNPVQCHGFQAHVGSMRSPSTGHVKLRSRDPNAAPSIFFNYMASEVDWQEMHDAVRITREIIAQKALDGFRGRELKPGPEVKTDAQLDEFIRAHVESAYHPSCTCKMGEDETAVVDGRGRVHGVEGLRVVDASIMPRVVTGNLNAPTIMIAEKVADMIRGRRPLAPAAVPYYVANGLPARNKAA